MTHDHGHGGQSHDHSQGHGQGQGHAHSHGPHHDDLDWDALAVHLEREAELQLPYLTEAARWLRGLLAESGGTGRESGHEVRRVLDVGSGPGVAACVLAGAFPAAEVVAVDASPFLLERAAARAATAGHGDLFRTLEAELPEGFDTLGTADVIWTSQAVHHLGDQEEALRRLGAAVRPGGLLAVAERGLPQRFLPRDIGIGRPGLQARLDAALEDWFTGMRGELPQSKDTVEDWPAMLAKAGLEPAGTRTFLTDHPAPLGHQAREHLRGHLGRVRERFTEGLDEVDLRTLDALIDDDAPTGILHRSDAFYLVATTVHTARARYIA
ncbi:class I SAM-dependent methyltransferase [Streptomyces sp. NPDC051976]|uniref:class I SAM-dependent methyltransferase n=1 Tax=Streptomyces sp. NPDC051976 TaxID=3154947 RepID=UPI0034436C4D